MTGFIFVVRAQELSTGVALVCLVQYPVPIPVPVIPYGVLPNFRLAHAELASELINAALVRSNLKLGIPDLPCPAKFKEA